MAVMPPNYLPPGTPGIPPMGAPAMPAGMPPPVIPDKPVETTKENVKLEEREEDDKSLEELIYSSDLGLTDEEKKVLASKICAEINDFLNSDERQDMLTKWDEWEREYDGIVSDKSSLFDGASNFHTYLGARHVDRARPRIKQAVFIRPFWIIDPREKADVEVIDKLENLMDYQAQIKIKLPEVYDSIINDCCKRGTGIVKITHYRKKEWFQDIETFSNPDEFVKVYGDEAKEKYKNFYNRLIKGERITFVSRYKDDSYRGPKVERVNCRDFVKTLDEKDLEKCRLVGHRFSLTWGEIQERFDDGIFTNIESLKYDYDKEGNPVLNPDYNEETYDFYEVIYKFRDNKNELKKGVFTVELEHEEMVQDITFPYLHNKCYFVPFYILKNEDSFWGYSLVGMVRQISRAEKRILDVLIDSGIVQNIPTFFRRQATGFSSAQGSWYPGKIFTTTDPNNDVKQLIVQGAPTALFNIIPLLEQFSEMRTGISSGMSGQSTPTDPNAPGNKTLALLNEANINVAEFVENFQSSNAEVGFQIGQLLYQFLDEDEEQRILGKGEKVITANITHEEAKHFRADFRPHGSTAISNKILQHQIDAIVRQTMLTSPVVAALVQEGRLDIVRELDEAFLKSAGGEWDKKIDKILPAPEELKKIGMEMKARKMMGIQTGGAPLNRMAPGGNGRRRAPMARPISKPPAQPRLPVRQTIGV